MTTVDIHSAKDLLQELVRDATSGEEVIIAESGKPLARLIAFVPARTKTKRRPGAMKGRIWIADEFDAPLPDALHSAFEGK